MFSFSQLPLLPSILNNVKGTITDSESGEPIPGVVITLTSGSYSHAMTADEKGFVYKSGLKNGMYQVKYEKEGYLPAISNFRVGIADTRDISVKLKKLKTAEPPVKKEKSLATKGAELLNARKYPEAVTVLTEAIEKTPENPLLYYYRGFALDKTGEQDKALADYKKSLEIDPEFQLSLGEAGKILAKKGDLEGAVVFYKKAYELGTSDVLALYNYGVCLINLAQNDEALKVFEKLLSLDPNYPDAFYQMGIIYLGQGDNNKAKEYLQKFIDLDPENENVSVAKEILTTI
jgi:tetratricopeptide (TPR) repeat protein